MILTFETLVGDGPHTWNGSSAHILDLNGTGSTVELNMGLSGTVPYMVKLWTLSGLTVNQANATTTVLNQSAEWTFVDDGNGNTLSYSSGDQFAKLQVGRDGSAISMLSRGVSIAMVNGVINIPVEPAVDNDNPIFIPHWHIQAGTPGLKLQVTRNNGAEDAGSFTVTSIKADGTTQTLDTSTIGYIMMTRVGG